MQVQDDVNQQILHMPKALFLLDATHVIKQFALPMQIMHKN